LCRAHHLVPSMKLVGTLRFAQPAYLASLR
jgi:hypothetical protein